MGIGGFLTIAIAVLMGAGITHLILQWRVGRTTEESLFDGCCWLTEQGGYGLDPDENRRASIKERKYRLFRWSSVSSIFLTVVLAVFLFAHMFIGMGRSVVIFGERMILLVPCLSAMVGSFVIVVMYEIEHRRAQAYVMLARVETGNADVILLRPMTGNPDDEVWRVSSDLFDVDCGYLSPEDSKGIVPDTICMVVNLVGRQYIQAVELN